MGNPTFACVKFSFAKLSASLSFASKTSVASLNLARQKEQVKGAQAKVRNEIEKPCIKRRERDSNPRYEKNSYNGLAISRFRPLSHLSKLKVMKPKKTFECFARNISCLCFG